MISLLKAGRLFAALWLGNGLKDFTSVCLRSLAMKLESHCLSAIGGVLFAAFGWCGPQASAGLLPFPVSADQRGYIYCLEAPTVYYDIYLPPAYLTNGPALPILYTFNPSGGGMVSDFQSVCRTLNIIGVGIIGSRNYGSTDIWMRECAAGTSPPWPGAW